jgi:midasin
VAIAVLTYGRHLRRAVDAGAFDFSAVHAILGWLKDSLDNYPPSFGPLFIAVQTLNEIVSLSAGFGLIDMWSNFYMRSLPATVRAELKKVEEFSCHMEECTRSLGMRCIVGLTIIGILMFESLALRSEAFKVMALVALTTVETQDTHVSEIVDLKTILEHVS